MCVEVEAEGFTIFFDAGSGIVEAGERLLETSTARKLHVFLSHAHYDHVEGLRDFPPLDREGWTVGFYGVGGAWSRHLQGLFRPPYARRTWKELAAETFVKSLASGAKVVLDPAKPGILGPRASVPAEGTVVVARQTRAHPKPGVTLYKLISSGRTVVYATDLDVARSRAEVVAFAKGADVLIHDAFYTDEEYETVGKTRAGWGHSTPRMAASLALEAEVGELLLFHHSPRRSDAEVARMEREARETFPTTRAAREGVEVHLR